MTTTTLSELTFIGTATTLLRLGPFVVLTDPNFLHRGERAWLGHGLTSKRLTEPAMQPDELPPLDAVVLSHLHGDHWDRRATAGLDHSVPVVTTTHAASRLRLRHGFTHATGLLPWESRTFAKHGYGLTVEAMPAVHSTNRFIRRLLPPVIGSVLTVTDPGGRAHRTYITGDTMPHEGFAQIAERHPQLDAAIVHIGGTTLPGGIVVTMTGQMGVDCLRTVMPAMAIPVHYDDYGLFKSGLDDFRRAADAAQLDVSIRTVGRGESVAMR